MIGHTRRTRHLLFIRVLSFFATLDHIAKNPFQWDPQNNCASLWIRTYKDKGKGKGKDVPLGVDPDHFWRQHQTNFRGSYLGPQSDDEAEQITYAAQELERMGRNQESSYKAGRLAES